MRIDNPTRIQYLTVCGGLPPARGKGCELTARERAEVTAVQNAIHGSSWLARFSQLWKRLPYTIGQLPTDAQRVCVSDIEAYATPFEFVAKAVEKIWHSIGTPNLDQDGEEITFHLEDGVWPYINSAEDIPATDILEVEDRIIDIAHVCSLIEDQFADLLTAFWAQRSFVIVKMVRDFIDYLSAKGFVSLDERACLKMTAIWQEVHPFAKGSEINAFQSYPYEKLQ